MSVSLALLLRACVFARARVLAHTCPSLLPPSRFVLARERNVFDWIQVALLDSVAETSTNASRRKDAVLDLRLLRSECSRAASMFRDELAGVQDVVQVVSIPTLQPFPPHLASVERLQQCSQHVAGVCVRVCVLARTRACIQHVAALQDVFARVQAHCDYSLELGSCSDDAHRQLFVALERLCNHLMEKMDSLTDLDAAQRSSRKAALSSCDQLAEHCRKRCG